MTNVPVAAVPSRRRILIAAGVLPLAFAAPAFVTPVFAAGKARAVASFSILADFARNVAGDRLDIVALVGRDSNAHVYTPSPADARQIAAARAIVINGLGLEGWMTRLIEAAGSTAQVIVASAGITPLTVNEDGVAATDPHAWQSVANARIYVANIRDGFAKADPAGTAIYAANATTYLTKLDTLETEVKAAMAAIPPARRRIITTHNAFGYFGAAYGLAVIAPEGVTTQSEASARDVARIITQIRRQHIPALFLESVSDPRLLEQIARESGARIGGTLYADALSAPDGPAATYIDMMRNNVKQFVLALSR
jgi:zinc/manganese transport system substrate-binding protein